MNISEIGGNIEHDNGIYMHLKNKVPYDPTIFVDETDELDNLIENASRKYGPAYRRWQTVRHASDLTQFPLTALEPSFIGRGKSPNEIKHEISEIGAYVNRSMIGSKMRYWDTLTGEKVHMGALLQLQDTFGAILARLRAQVLKSPPAKEFREGIYQYCSTEPIKIYSNKYGYQQEIDIPYLPFEIPSELHEPNLLPQDFSPSDPYGLMRNIGRVGHPVVREATNDLSYADRNLYLRTLL